MTDSRSTGGKSGQGSVPETEKRRAAVAIRDPSGTGDAKKARIDASGYGYVAEQILQLAFAHGVKVRQDASLAEILTALDIDTPIPPEAILAVADILARVYAANQSLAGAAKEEPKPSSATATAKNPLPPNKAGKP